MGLNYGISINIFDIDGVTPIPNAKVHAYFKNNNISSSTSVWNTDIQKTIATGKTSFNLGDLSFLTSNGIINNGDEILITAWLTNNSDVLIDDKTSKLPNTITRCINFIHTVNIASSTYVENIVLLPVNTPICNYTIPSVTSVTNTGHNFNIINNSYINNGPFNINIGSVVRNDLYQDTIKYSQNLFLGLDIEKSIYNYGENTIQTISTIDSNYSYINAGDYNCIFETYNFLGYKCSNSISYHILFNKPTILFDYTFTKLLNTDKHIGVGNDDLLRTIQQSSPNFGDTWLKLNATFEWTISDLTLLGIDNSDIYIGKDELFMPTKLYQSSGIKNIKLDIKWNDGFTNNIETMTLNPFLDKYNINLAYDWITDKKYINNGIYTTLGDNDLITFTQSNYDNATQNYNSNSQWKTLEWNFIKKKNDGTPDNTILTLSASALDNYNSIFTSYIKYLHTNLDYAVITQTLIFWDGWEDITKTLSYNLISKEYTIIQDFQWDTAFYGLNKVITSDNDSVTLTNNSIFQPQDNQALVQEDRYNIIKNRYTSYIDNTIINDDEVFVYSTLLNNPIFFVHKDGLFDVINTITYYNGFNSVSSILTKTLEAKPHIATPKITWTSRNGIETYVEGRDDLCTFENISYQTDFYGTKKAINSSRNLSIDWSINNYITKGNFSGINSIGGNTFTVSNNNIEVFNNSLITYKPLINYYSELLSQDINIIFYYNDGFFNRNISNLRTIETRAYTDIIPGILTNNNIPDRNTNINFSDNSTNNENRIIDIDWSLTDRYGINSMNINLRGTDNLQLWNNQLKGTNIITTINSFENHILSQDIIRWDNGFVLKTFNNSLIINTTKYTVNPDFSYIHKYNTGPEIVFTNISSINTGAILLSYDLEITDSDNNGIDTSVAYRNIPMSQVQEHIYKSVSNSPFSVDLYNKPVTIFQNFDNGWDEDYLTLTRNILVKPNRISQDFITQPLRHPSDTETSNLIITGNNPIKFFDNSTTLRTDINFIKSVEYTITEIC